MVEQLVGCQRTFKEAPQPMGQGHNKLAGCFLMHFTKYSTQEPDAKDCWYILTGLVGRTHLRSRTAFALLFALCDLAAYSCLETSVCGLLRVKIDSSADS